MPRGFKRDESWTRLGRSVGIAIREDGAAGYLYLIDKRSFISQPKIIKGECTEPKPHLILYGEDKAPIRAEIFRRNREANHGINRCVKCGQIVAEDIYTYMVGEWRKGEWDHIRNKPGERCDCPENGRVACDACHSERHPKPMFGIKKEATK